MKKVFCSFIIMFLLCMMFSINVHAAVTTADYRIIGDRKSSSVSSAFIDNNPSSKSVFVFIEDINYMLYLSSDELHSFYLMDIPLGGTDAYTFYDGYRNTTSNYNNILPINGRDYQLPYSISRTGLGDDFSISYPDVRYKNMDEFIKALSDAGDYTSFMNSSFDNNGGDDENNDFLPSLKYSFSKKWYAKLSNDFWRYSLITNWDYKEIDPYTSEPDKYKVQIIAFLNGHNSDYQKLSDVNTWYWVTKGQSVASNEYKFSLEDTVNNIRTKFNFPAVTENILLNVYIRTYDPVSGKVSKWCGVTIQDPCGAPIIRPTVYPDGFDNNVDTEADSPIDNGGYESGGEDDSRSDPNSDNYVDPSTLQGIDSIIANLKSLAIAVGTIPSLLNDVYLWLPSDLIVLISASIGLVVLIGVMKWAR